MLARTRSMQHRTQLIPFSLLLVFTATGTPAEPTTFSGGKIESERGICRSILRTVKNPLTRRNTTGRNKCSQSRTRDIKVNERAESVVLNTWDVKSN